MAGRYTLGLGHGVACSIWFGRLLGFVCGICFPVELFLIFGLLVLA